MADDQHADDQHADDQHADDQQAEEQGPTVGFRDRDDTAVREESLGERVLGSLLDRAHLIPPRLVGPLVAQELAGLACRDVAIHLQDYDQRTLQPLRGRGLLAEVLPIDGSAAGRAFATEEPVETDEGGGAVRLHLPMLDGSDRVGVLSFTLDRVNAHDRRLAQRLAGLVADLIARRGEGAAAARGRGPVFTDGVVEERLDDGEQFGEHRLREVLEQSSTDGLRVPETVRRLSHALMDARHGRTSDDASLLLVEWKQPPHDDELSPDIPEARPTGGRDG